MLVGRRERLPPPLAHRTTWSGIPLRTESSTGREARGPLVSLDAKQKILRIERDAIVSKTSATRAGSCCRDQRGPLDGRGCSAWRLMLSGTRDDARELSEIPEVPPMVQGSTRASTVLSLDPRSEQRSVVFIYVHGFAAIWPRRFREGNSVALVT